ncbi:BTAD domain-containing putative transcriptional regulator [Amycolatopsis rhabdoformis]|uniref:BTAD domain-containing putative transcriptional regulator n=1 Tax=Amycolatopsis rhabdoformis TaxID=1448059 RepID=A0ABZ1IG89_9PSEU|nr:BTAD domain-containing putative transcriptional regulator [Amycolatopsis rhabdoformis]WSE33470.1 BTAD domain-containing putative transcriptional regulator [Amycolatopsis rhabdoformis]
MRFQVLGPLAAAPLTVALPSAAQPRRLLALLLARPNEVVGRATIVDELWPDGAPPSAAAIVQVTVSKLRKALSPGLAADDPAQRLKSGPRGYKLTVAEGELDAEEFVALASAGLAAEDSRTRRDLLTRALGCWRGGAFCDVATGPLVEAHEVWLDDRRRTVLLQLVELQLAEGDEQAVVHRLAPVVAARPADERLAGRLADALAGLGRRDAALDVLRRTRRALWAEAGVVPGPELDALYRRVAGAEWTAGGPPAQLPAPVPDFTGRAAELAAVTRHLRTPAPVVAHGAAGAGKSALAVQAAWRTRRRFPDGQLVADLAAAEPRDVLIAFLRALGAATAELTGDLTALVAAWRSHTVDRRLLVLLENARTEAHVRPLLPSGAGCGVLVTARRPLPGLAAARPVPVGELSTVDARALLTAVAGEPRIAAEPEAADAVVARCAGLALAVRIAGLRLAARAHLRVADLATRLGDDRRALEELTAGDLSVRAAVLPALRECTAEDRDLLRLLGLFRRPVPDWCAAALLGVRAAEARDRLDALADTHVLTADEHGRHAVPRFVRLGLGPLPGPDRAALRRALESVLALSERVLSLLDHGFTPAGPPVTAPEVSVVRAATADPEGWRRRETELVATAARLAGRHHWHALAARLSDACAALAGTPWLGRSARAVSIVGLAAARRLGDRPGEAGKLFTLASVHWQAGRSRQARTYFSLAGNRFEALGDPRGRGAALVALADLDADAGLAELAVTELREALALLRECGDVRGQAIAAAQFGGLSEDLGDVRRAVESFEAALLLAGGCAGRWHDQVAKRYADVLRRHGRTDRAADLLTGALGGAVRTRERHWEAHVLRSLGDLHTDAGEVAEGERCLTRSLDLFEQIGHRHAAAYTHRSLAEARLRAADPAGARRHLRSAMTVFQDLRDRRGTGYALLSLGKTHAGTGSGSGARRALGGAAEVFCDLGFPLWELRALRELNAASSDSPAGARAREVLAKIRF